MTTLNGYRLSLLHIWQKHRLMISIIFCTVIVIIAIIPTIYFTPSTVFHGCAFGME
ncbi:hypothetical protein D3C73_1483000 [compost metagenome]